MGRRGCLDETVILVFSGRFAGINFDSYSAIIFSLSQHSKSGVTTDWVLLVVSADL